ncbi:hypothetical protein DAEQUDRAFT_725049 [Daedalea quercina L-15889]|uniref:C2H2-type domain-containing protein n=1 Tax=Daedalea quercina L-15889 TaxID=1314783 RepID=A0A165RKR1_9APHY|nr:hypothetical protein DAEQUDRAFT_725049 [Daedalea quercina L-15889]
MSSAFSFNLLMMEIAKGQSQLESTGDFEAIRYEDIVPSPSIERTPNVLSQNIWICSQCGKEFKRKDTFDRHIATAH